MQPLTCIYCGSANFSRAYQRADGRAIVGCQDCGLLFISDIPDNIAELYGTDYFHKTESASGNGYANYDGLDPIAFRWQLALSRLFSGHTADCAKTILDLGCATGHFLKMAGAAGFHCAGVEISPSAAESVRQQGFPVLVSSFESANPAPVDLVTAWDFIEHVVDLRTTFEKVRSTLLDGGVFLFATPDGGSARAQEHGEKWICLNSSFEHITYLTIPFLERALRETFGCEPLLLSFDVGEFWTSIIGIVRVGGLTEQDRRIGQLLRSQGQPSSDEEITKFGSELGFFYATFMQLAALSRLIERADGLLPPATVAALHGGLLYLSDQFPESIPWLRQGLSAEPLCAAWLAAANAHTLTLREQNHQSQLEQQNRSAADQIARLRNEINQLREVNDQIIHSVTWKVGRKITQPIESVPHSRAVLSGLQQFRERGPLRSLQAAHSYVQAITDSSSANQSKAQRLATASLKVTEYVTEHVLPGRLPNLVPAFLQDKLPLLRSKQSQEPASAGLGPPSEIPPRDTVTHTSTSPRNSESASAVPASVLLSDPALVRHQGLPLVSVILPVYNQTDLLRSSVLSVLSQSYPHLELIIVDDGSREDVAASLEGLLDLPSVHLFRQVNQKLPRALSNAFQFAKGELLTWTSADNLMHPHAIARLAESLFRHPEAVLAYADVDIIDDNGKPITDGSYRELNVDPIAPEVVRLCRSDVPLSAERDNYVNACFLYRRNAAAAMGHVYSDSLRGAEDYDFWLRLRRCGRLLHIGNREPLYSYRVHQRSMSHDLLTQERNEHYARVSLLIDLEEQRRSFARQRWDVVLDPALPYRTRTTLQEQLQQLPVNLAVPGAQDAGSGRKNLSIVPEDAQPAQSRSWQVFARVLPDSYELVCRPSPSAVQSGVERPPQRERVMPLLRGCTSSSLLMKARDVQHSARALPPAVAGRPVFAISVPLQRIGSGIDRLRQIITANPWAYFLFVSVASPSEMLRLEGLSNAGFVEKFLLDSSYEVYGMVNWTLVPPCEPPLSQGEYLQQLADSYSTGHPLILSSGQPLVMAPYQLCLGDDPSLSLSFAKQLRRDMMQLEVLNSYLEEWQPERCLANLLRHANTFAQDFAVPQPNTGITPPPYAEPQPVQVISAGAQPLRNVMLVDSLDVGGLEEVVAFLVRNLHQHGVRTAVACFQRGGQVADKLRAEGHDIVLAEGNEQRLHSQLQQLDPQIINSHYASLPALLAAERLSRPIVETIHNTYVWLSPEQWKIEAERSRRFAKGLAVSGLVKRYYHAHNPTLPTDRVIVVGNAIDPERITAVSRDEARRALGIPDSATLFLCLGRYCSQKNQIGIVHAFAQLAARDPQAILLCMGNVPPEERAYYQQLQALCESLPCRDRIRLDSYHPSVSTVLSAADAMVMNSFFEGWSLAATEALLTGTPLIHSLCGSAEELCGASAERGFVIPNPGGDIMQLQIGALVDIASRAEQPNQTELIRAMDRVVAERDRLRSDRDAISAYVRRVFHPTAILSRYAQTFRALTRN